jgi:hypothetical protein
MSKPIVTQVLKFKTAQEGANRLQALRAQYRKLCPDTGLRLYKTAAGVVLREKSAVEYEVLANCAC